jgi:threonine synthase
MNFYCAICGREYPVAGLDYRCRCGGLFKLAKTRDEQFGSGISLGEVRTPMIRRTLQDRTVYLKLDYMQPTGSFKDRGAVFMVNNLKEMGIREVIEDSSGNAGAAIAGYCTAAGIKCSIYLPEQTTTGKIRQIYAYQADIVTVPGTRRDTSQAIIKAAGTTYYASHVFNPLFVEGVKSLAYEILEQVGVPDYVVVPAGNGTMLLGIYLGFKEIGRLPRIIAVQSERCAPVFSKFKRRPAGAMRPTVAEGIEIQEPARIDEMIAAVRDSGGDVIVVDDESIIRAKEMLGAMGLYVEPTSGVAVAGMLQYFPRGYGGDAVIAVPLTGAGLKE